MKVTIIISYCFSKDKENVKKSFDLIVSVKKKLRKPSDLEILVFNDGGNDDLDFIRPQKGVRYFRSEENLGIAKARNTSINLVSSGYILFLDADDTFLPEGLLKLTTYISEQVHNELNLFLFNGLNSDGESLSLFIKSPKVSIPRKKYQRHNIWLCCFPSSALRRILAPSDFGEDLYLLLSLIRKFHTEIIEFNEAVYFYTLAPESYSLSSDLSWKKIKSRMILLIYWMYSFKIKDPARSLWIYGLVNIIKCFCVDVSRFLNFSIHRK